MNKQDTILSYTISRDNRNNINIKIYDEHSGDLLVESEMSSGDFGKLVTGLSGQKAESQVNLLCNVAKKRETKRVSCPKVECRSKTKQSLVVLEDYKERYQAEGWFLHSDGVITEQPSPEHVYIIKRYTPVEDPFKIEGKY